MSLNFPISHFREKDFHEISLRFRFIYFRVRMRNYAKKFAKCNRKFSFRLETLLPSTYPHPFLFEPTTSCPAFNLKVFVHVFENTQNNKFLFFLIIVANPEYASVTFVLKTSWGKWHL